MTQWGGAGCKTRGRYRAGLGNVGAHGVESLGMGIAAPCPIVVGWAGEGKLGRAKGRGGKGAQGGGGIVYPFTASVIFSKKGLHPAQQAQEMRRLTRLTNAFSKKLANLKAALALHFAWYNFGRVLGSLRVTPAMEAGIAEHIWTMGELLDL